MITLVVGSSTFVRPGAAESLPASSTPVVNEENPPDEQSSPAELMEARLVIELLMPKLIACNATKSDFSRMKDCLNRCEGAQTIEEFEPWEGEFHRTLVPATHNSFFLEDS